MKTVDILKTLNEKEPLIHCITNPISMTQCANAVLALGAKPIMAEHPAEVREITASAGALLLNLGNISDIRMEAMERAYEAAVERGIPVVIDAVGTACSALRREFVLKLLKDSGKQGQALIVKGNYSEIMALYDAAYKGKGVDADKSLELEAITQVAAKIAENYGVVVLASGKTDIVTDGRKEYLIENGTFFLGKITGTGCMLGAVAAAFLGGDPGDAAEICALSAAAFGIAGELAEEALLSEKGKVVSGSFLTALLDELSFLTDEKIRERMRITAKNET